MSSILKLRIAREIIATGHVKYAADGLNLWNNYWSDSIPTF